MKYSVSDKGYYYKELEGGDKIRISQDEFMNNQEVVLTNDKHDVGMDVGMDVDMDVGMDVDMDVDMGMDKHEGGIIQQEKTGKHTFSAILVSGIVLLFTGVISGL
jgi:hypothetical protein